MVYIQFSWKKNCLHALNIFGLTLTSGTLEDQARSAESFNVRMNDTNVLEFKQ